MQIRVDDLSSPQVQDLLRYHLSQMMVHSPPGACHALDLSGLQTPDITVWTAWDDEALLGVGALKVHDAVLGEVKSMRTHPNSLGKGVGAAILDHIIGAARAKGLRKLSLETGDGPSFQPALSLYRKRGFVQGERFADYPASDFNLYFHLGLD